MVSVSTFLFCFARKTFRTKQDLCFRWLPGPFVWLLKCVPRQGKYSNLNKDLRFYCYLPLCFGNQVAPLFIVKDMSRWHNSFVIPIRSENETPARLKPSRSGQIIYNAVLAALTVMGWSPKPTPMLVDMSASMWIKNSWLPCWPVQSCKGSTLVLKPRADITRSPKQGCQWPHEKELCPPNFI